MNPPIWSPCKKICLVDSDQAICVGCFRTLDELGRWTIMSDAERQAVRAELKARETTYRARRKPA